MSAPWEVDDTEGGTPWEVDDTKSPGSALRGAEIKPQRSLSEAGTDFLTGFVKELPLMASRGVGLLQDVAQGQQPWDPAVAAERAAREKKINEWLGAADTAGQSEQRPGRVLARMVPGAAAAYLTGGMSLPAQATIQGGVQGLQSLSEGATPGEAALGAVMAGGAPLLMGGLNLGATKAKNLFTSKVDVPAKQAFERLGVEPPASAITHSRPAQLIEQGAAFSLGGQKITDRAERALAGLKSQAEDLSRGANPTVGGKSLAADEQAYREALRATKNAEYGKVGNLTGIQAAPQQTLAEIDRLLAQGTLDPETLANLRKLRVAIAPEQNDLPEWVRLSLAQHADNPAMQEEVMRRYASAGGSAAQQSSRPSVADLMSQQAGIEYGGPNALRDAGLGNKLRDLLGKDYHAALEGAAPDQAAQLRTAKDAYGRYSDFANSTMGQRIPDLKAAGQFDKIVSSVVNPGDSIHDIRRVMEVASPETRGQIQSEVLASVIGTTGEAEIKITPEAFANAINKRWKPERLKAILEPEQYERLQDLAHAAQAMGKAQRISGGSQTAPLLRAGQYLTLAPSMLMSIVLGHPLAALGMGATAGLEAGTAAAIGSKGGQKWLTTGLGKATLPGRMLSAPLTAGSRAPSEIGMAERRRRAELDALLAGAE